MLLVLFVLVVAELVAVRLWDEFHTVQHKYLDRSPAPITEAQKQSAVDLVEASGIVERISSGQSWEITAVRDHPGIRTVSVYVEWAEAVESNGPWLTNGAPNWLGRSAETCALVSVCRSATYAICAFRHRGDGGRCRDGGGCRGDGGGPCGDGGGAWRRRWAKEHPWPQRRRLEVTPTASLVFPAKAGIHVPPTPGIARRLQATVKPLG